MAGNYAFMQKKGEGIIKVPLNKWASYRRSGYEFRTEEEFSKQQSRRVAESVEEAPTAAPKKKKKRKAKRS